MKTNVIALLLGGSALILAPGSAFAQDATPAPAPAPASTPAPAVSADVTGAGSEGHVVYPASYFAKYSPKNALDMLNQLPGFSITGAGQGRGLGEASVNVLIN